jgi:4-amino-4-deoxy-L-arabinose transferase-like glycosyltransferase
MHLPKLVRWEQLVVLALLLVIPVLVLYNLDSNPRPWHDEGAALSVSKTLVQDGVYAVRTSDGYQTFGPIQSIGPTVLLPVALSFKVLGIGLFQGRIVAAFYLALTLAVFYRLARDLYGRPTALLAIVFLLGSSSARILLIGRQVLGEVPAFGFFLGGWLLWMRAVKHGSRLLLVLAGLALGAAMVTKSQYLLIGVGALGVLVVLDFLFYKQGYLKSLITTGIVAIACIAVWFAWQIFYYGGATFQENAVKLRELAASTTGFDLRLTADAIKFLLGPESDHLYFFWGFPALLYVGFLSLKRTPKGFYQGYLFAFTVLWFTYFVFWIIPWRHYALAAASLSALFVAKLWHDLVASLLSTPKMIWAELSQSRPGPAVLFAAVIAALCFVMLNPLRIAIQSDVFDAYQEPKQAAAFIDTALASGCVIETWERELDVMTRQSYHFPDQSILAQAHGALFRNQASDYAMGEAYFQAHQPAYLIYGWYAKLEHGYDMDFVAQHGTLVKTIGDYDIYRMNLRSAAAVDSKDAPTCP